MLSIQELRSSSPKELLLELQKARKEMLKIRINLKTKHEKDTSKARKEKRLIAQILTLLKEPEKAPSDKPMKTAKPEEKAAKVVAEAPAKAKTPAKKTAKASTRPASVKKNS
jgi:ribosomal protein L29